MKVLAFRGLALLSISLLVSGSMAQVAQSFGDLPAVEYPLEALPDSLRAYQITTSSDSQAESVLATRRLMAGLAALGVVSEAELKQSGFDLASIKEPILDYLGLYWSDGKVSEIGGKNFIRVYTPRPDFAGIDPAKARTIRFRLTLLAVDSIVSLTPRPDFTVAQFRAMAKTAVKGKTSNTTQSSQSTPAMPEAGKDTPAPLKDVSMKNPTSPVPAVRESVVEGPAKPSMADKVEQMNRIKNLGLAAQLYASDYDDVFPYVQSTAGAFETIEPYAKSRQVFESKNLTGGFRFNLALAGVRLTSVPQPAEIPLFFESEPWTDGGRWVVFVDGHTKFCSEKDWEALKSIFKLRFPRVGKSLSPKLGLGKWKID